jgi:hypothetical protein
MVALEDRPLGRVAGEGAVARRDVHHRADLIDEAAE